jgi:hypothetical protein
MSAALIAAGSAEKGVTLPIPPIAFALLTIALFGLLLLVTFAFRGVGHRH